MQLELSFNSVLTLETHHIKEQTWPKQQNMAFQNNLLNQVIEISKQKQNKQNKTNKVCMICYNREKRKQTKNIQVQNLQCFWHTHY